MRTSGRAVRCFGRGVIVRRAFVSRGNGVGAVVGLLRVRHLKITHRSYVRNYCTRPGGSNYNYATLLYKSAEFQYSLR